MRPLSKRLEFFAPGREPVTFAILSYFGWGFEYDENIIENPWCPLMDLVYDGFALTGWSFQKRKMSVC